jgi:hypothetical protein
MICLSPLGGGHDVAVQLAVHGNALATGQQQAGDAQCGEPQCRRGIVSEELLNQIRGQRRPTPHAVRGTIIVTEAQGMIKVLAFTVLGILAVGPITGSAAGAERTIRVQADAAVTLDLAAEAKTVLVTNPAIADVTPINGRKLIVLGRGTGQTGLLIFDDAGKSLLEATVLVTPARQGAVTIHRGVNGKTLSCNPRCSDEGNGAPAPAAGAGKAP